MTTIFTIFMNNIENLWIIYGYFMFLFITDLNNHIIFLLLHDCRIILYMFIVKFYANIYIYIL